MTLCDYHIHSTYSDGRSTMHEIAEAAVARGMTAIGFSDHGYTPHDESYCMPRDRLDEYIAECHSLRGEFGDRLDIRCGIEQDYFGGRADGRLDYVIGSVHYLPAGGGALPIDEGAQELGELIDRFYGGDIISAAQTYFSLVGRIGEVTGADVVGHFDLITKFAERGIPIDTSSPGYRSAWREAADRLISEGLVFEINTGALSRGYRTSPYPSEEMIDYIAERGGRFILSSDSHRAETVGYLFQRYGERYGGLLTSLPLKQPR